MHFKNRHDAGVRLSQQLKKYQDQDVVVYALPRGGVVLAAEIASFLHAPLDLLFAHKIGHPQQVEYAIAAVSESGCMVESEREQPFIDAHWLNDEKEHQIEEIKRKRKLYLKDKADQPVHNKIAILVDDGIATGLTMLVGIAELKKREPKKIVVAVPIAPKNTVAMLMKYSDEFVGFEVDNNQFLGSVSAYYDEFKQVEDQEVIHILEKN